MVAGRAETAGAASAERSAAKKAAKKTTTPTPLTGKPPAHPKQQRRNPEGMRTGAALDRYRGGGRPRVGLTSSRTRPRRDGTEDKGLKPHATSVPTRSAPRGRPRPRRPTREVRRRKSDRSMTTDEHAKHAPSTSPRARASRTPSWCPTAHPPRPSAPHHGGRRRGLLGAAAGRRLRHQHTLPAGLEGFGHPGTACWAWRPVDTSGGRWEVRRAVELPGDRAEQLAQRGDKKLRDRTPSGRRTSFHAWGGPVAAGPGLRGAHRRAARTGAGPAVAGRSSRRTT